jgi:formate dehydrogenase subunit gamma
VNLWTAAELRWMRTLGRKRLDAPDKFNPGQKLNTLFIGGAIVVMLATGFVLKWYRFFPLSWRTGATFVHDVLALGIFLVIIGHIALALTHREALRSMLSGRVTAEWARRHASGWLAEEQAAADAGQRAKQPDSTN